MTEDQNAEVQHAISINGHTLMFPISQQEFTQLPVEQQIAAYDEATATQIQWTDDNIQQDADWVAAARVVFDNVHRASANPAAREQHERAASDYMLSPAERAMARGEARIRSSADMSEEELGAWLFDHVGELHGNLSGLLVAVADASNNPEYARALNIAMMRYENKDISSQGVGNVIEGTLTDPLTYVGIGALTQAVKGAVGRQAIQGAVRRRLTQVLLSSTAASALEGGVYTAADDASRQHLAMEANVQEEWDYGRTGMSTAFGTILGAGFGFVLGDLVGMATRGADDLAAGSTTRAGSGSTTGVASDAAADVMPLVTNEVGEAASNVPAVLPPAPTMDSLNNMIPAGVMDDFTDPHIPLEGQTYDRLVESIQTRLQGLIDSGTREGSFDVDTMNNAASAAQYLRQFFLSDNPEIRRAANQALTNSKNGTPTAQTLLDDAVRRAEDLLEEIDYQRALDTPDPTRILALEHGAAAEQMRVAEFAQMTGDLSSEAGTQLRAIQARTADNLGIVQAVDEGNLHGIYEELRVATLRSTDVPAVDGAVEGSRRGIISKLRESPSIAAAVEWQRNSLLSGPATFITNTLGPVVNYTTEFVEEGLGSIGTRYADETAELAWSRVEGITRQLGTSFDVAWRAMKEHRVATGVDFIDGESAGTRAITAEAFGIDQYSGGAAVVNFLGKTVRLVDGLQLMSDGFLSSRIAISEVFAQAKRRGVSRGLSGDELNRYIAAQIDRTFDPNTGRIINSELLHETERLMMRARPPRNAADKTKTDWLIAAGESLYRTMPAVRIMQPFWRTPLRLLQAGGRRIPVLQNFSTSFRRDLSGQNGYKAYIRARGQIITAYSLAGLVAASTMVGFMKGEPHSQRDWRIAAEGEDLDANFSVGGVVLDRLDPISTPIRTISLLTEEMMYQAHLGNEERYEEASEQMMAATVALASSLSASTVEQTMLQGFEDAFEAFNIATNPDNPDIGTAAGRWFAQRASTFYPNILKKVEDMQDPTRERGSDFGSALLASTGLADTMRTLDGWNTFLSANLVTKRRNILGEVIEFDAVRSTFGVVSDENSDPLREHLQEAMVTSGIFLNPMRYRRPEANNMDLRQIMTDDGETTIFDAWQANLQNVGLREHLENLIASDAYQQASFGRQGRPGLRIQLLRDAFSSARDAAWELTMHENRQFNRRLVLEQFDERLRATQ